MKLTTSAISLVEKSRCWKAVWRLRQCRWHGGSRCSSIPPLPIKVMPKKIGGIRLWIRVGYQVDQLLTLLGLMPVLAFWSWWRRSWQKRWQQHPQHRQQACHRQDNFSNLLTWLWQKRRYKKSVVFWVKDREDKHTDQKSLVEQFIQ